MQTENRRKLTDFERGVLWSVFVVQKNTNQASIAAQVLREAKFTHLDCFELPVHVKAVLKVVNLEDGLSLSGLDE